MSAAPVRIVVDSTADLPRELAADLGISVVPLTVHFGARSYRDGVDLTPAQFMHHLTRGGVQPTTSQAVPEAFLGVYRALHAEGAEIVSLHVSADLSGTYNSALLAAREMAEAGVTVEVIDTRTVASALGIIAIEAATAARGGADRAAVLALVAEAMRRIHLVFTLDTLEYLQRGGRIGRARALVGTLLSIKPLLTVADGVVTPMEQARTRQKAITRVVERARALAERDIRRLSILHSADLEVAEHLRVELGDLVPPERLMVVEIGAAIAVYTGPRAAGFAALTAR